MKEINKDPSLLNTKIQIEQVAADEKNGTNACLKYGDVLSVKDLLYALMLPSGNDAAVALAN
jgi:D-alanyl-D-alanine carboxypeptidase (penicillin-binding protein 5/6)